MIKRKLVQTMMIGVEGIVWIDSFVFGFPPISDPVQQEIRPRNRELEGIPVVSPWSIGLWW